MLWRAIDFHLNILSLSRPLFRFFRLKTVIYDDVCSVCGPGPSKKDDIEGALSNSLLTLA
jgi:hypothetical protein